MPRFETLPAALLLGAVLLGATVAAQGTGRWTIGAPMPSARTEVAVAEVGGKIYVVGGFGGERELEIYDPAADRWSRGAAIARELHHAAAVGLDGKLYVIGGYVDGWTPTNEVYEYDPAGNRWRPLAPLPTPRGALAAAVLDGKIHAVGGVGWRSRNTAAHEVYDPATNRWTALASVPTPRDHLAVAAIDGRLYAIGGRVDGSYARNLAATRLTIPPPTAGSRGRRCRRCAAGLPRPCSRDAFSLSVAKRPPGPSTRWKATMPRATAGAAMPACRRRGMALEPRWWPAKCMSSQVGPRPAPRRRPPTRFSRPDAVARQSSPPLP